MGPQGTSRQVGKPLEAIANANEYSFKCLCDRTLGASSPTRSLTACFSTNCGCPRSRFWDLGKHELKVRNHPVRDLGDSTFMPF
jgi:hypothetical protein